MPADNSIQERLRRIETRLSHYMRWNGYDPSREVSSEIEQRVFYQDGALHITSPATTVGDILQAVHLHKLSGAVPLTANGTRVGVFNVERNFGGPR